MTAETDVVGRLWGFAHNLRHDGVDYGDYIEQITYLLFLKMADEQGITEIPVGCDWPHLRRLSGVALTEGYEDALRTLGKQRGILGDIFAASQNRLSNPATLAQLIKSIDETEWTSLNVDVKAAAFEGLLEKAAAEGKKGAGQYFTPRPLIECMVRLMQPDPRASKNFTIGDPACGTGGFLVAAYDWLKQQTGGAFDRDTARRIRTKTYFGQDLVARPRRLARMNLYLHQVEPHITLGDSIYETPTSQRFDVILTNPPFGTKGANQAPARDDFVVETSNKQLNFIQHVLTLLKPGGRCAIVVPDSVLFADQAGEVFKVLMEDCDVHTVLRCPRGTFAPYTQTTKTNVLFFTKGEPTKRLWVYDARTNVQTITKQSRPLTAAYFADFKRCYGQDPNGRVRRAEADSADDRWRSFEIEQIIDRSYKIDGFKWLRDDERDNGEAFADPAELVTEAIAELQAALVELHDMRRLLDGSPIQGPLIELSRTAGPPHLESMLGIVRRLRASALAEAASGRLSESWREEHIGSADAIVACLLEASKSRRKPVARPEPELLDDLPEGWQAVTLDLLIERIEAGKSVRAEGRPASLSEWGIIKVSAMSWGAFLETENKAVLDSSLVNPRYEIKPDDLLISRANTVDLVGASVHVATTRPRLLLSDKSLRLVPHAGIDKAWLNLTLAAPVTRRQLSQRATGTSESMRNLAQSKILATTVGLPPLDEQHEIVRRATAVLRAADRLGAASPMGRALGGSGIAAAPDDLPGDAVLTMDERAKPNGCHYDGEVRIRTT